MKKFVIFIITLVLLVIFYIVFLSFPKEYSYNYTIGKYKVTESFAKKRGIYSFTIKNKNKKEYKYSIKHKYISKRSLIKSIKTNSNCITVNFLKLNTFSTCIDKNKNVQISPYYDEKIENKKTDSYKNLNIYDLHNYKYFIWNYNNLLSVDNKTKKTINLFDSDIYTLDLITVLDHFLIIANYNDDYTFNLFYKVDMRTNKVDKVKINRKLHFTSYILGNVKKDIYLYDPELEKEFKFNPFDETIDETKYAVYKNGKWEDISINKLNKKSVIFETKSDFYYKIKDGKLYYHMPNVEILVSNLDISSIVQSDENKCFFISKDSLYFTEFENGIVKVMSYSEWQFNHQNIYIY